jgi:uncharacterized protein YqgV (UPF0045/DUF77 family)
MGMYMHLYKLSYMYKSMRTDIEMDIDTVFYILKNMPPPPRRKLANVILGKNVKREM